jgi:hypothetical protein
VGHDAGYVRVRAVRKNPERFFFFFVRFFVERAAEFDCNY